MPENAEKKPVRKKNYCGYCEKLVSKFAEHLQTLHPNIAEGKSLASVEGDSKTRKTLKTKITVPIRKQ